MNGKYELMLILKSETEDFDEKKLTALLKKYLDKESKIVSSKSWGKKSLSYPIKKQTEGIYWLITLEMPGKEVKTLTEKFRLDKVILRHLFTKLD